MKKVSSSFVVGAIALVFAVLGYQTALLVHWSAVSCIVANRDNPDTVYVSEGQPEGFPKADAAGSSDGSSSGAPVRSRRQSSQYLSRHTSPHSKVAEKVRSEVKPRETESFRFNPNTVTVEELIRLGFSSKQAQSIDNYRKKGGRFRRKEDFAKSYVVADSVYERLDSFIDIPGIDINAADSAAFDSLPGIGGYFARKIVEYRTRLHGYSCTEQLMEIRNFTPEKYEALKDLVFAGPCKPYPLWTLPEDSLVKHPYINSRTVARSIVFYRKNNPVGLWTVDGMLDAGILDEQRAQKLSRCRIARPE